MALYLYSIFFFFTVMAFYKCKNSYHDMDQTIQKPHPCEKIFK